MKVPRKLAVEIKEDFSEVADIQYKVRGDGAEYWEVTGWVNESLSTVRYYKTGLKTLKSGEMPRKERQNG